MNTSCTCRAVGGEVLVLEVFALRLEKMLSRGALS
jgi:hypothetical protein